MIISKLAFTCQCKGDATALMVYSSKWPKAAGNLAEHIDQLNQRKPTVSCIDMSIALSYNKYKHLFDFGRFDFTFL